MLCLFSELSLSDLSFYFKDTECLKGKQMMSFTFDKCINALILNCNKWKNQRKNIRVSLWEPGDRWLLFHNAWNLDTRRKRLHLLVTCDTTETLKDSFLPERCRIHKQLFFCLKSKCCSIQNFKSYQVAWLRVHMSGIWEMGLSHNRDK